MQFPNYIIWTFVLICSNLLHSIPLAQRNISLYSTQTIKNYIYFFTVYVLYIHSLCSPYSIIIYTTQGRYGRNTTYKHDGMEMCMVCCRVNMKSWCLSYRQNHQLFVLLCSYTIIYPNILFVFFLSRSIFNVKTNKNFIIGYLKKPIVFFFSSSIKRDNERQKLELSQF